MLVKLRRPVYFDQLYSPSLYGTEIPDRFADQLPKDAERLDAPLVPKEKKTQTPKALSEVAKGSTPKTFVEAMKEEE